MNIIKLGLISFIILFLVVTGISLFIPSHVRISRAVNVKAEKDAVMQQFTNPVNWKNWYPGLDTARVYYENGVAKGVNINSGTKEASIIITGQNADEVITEFRSSRPPVVNGWNTIGHEKSDSLTIQWYMDVQLPWYPWEKFASLLFEKSYGTRMEQGLGRLKKIVQPGDSSLN